MKIAIVTDSNCGINNELLNIENLFILPMPFIIDNEEYFENKTISHEEFYARQKQTTKITTSQPSPMQVMDCWDKALKTYDHILHISMSSALSESCNTARMLSQGYNGKVTVIDNKKISITLKSSIFDALELIKQGKMPEDIKSLLEDKANHTNIYMVVPTVTHLKRGGRITPAAAALATVLNIKPILKLGTEKIDSFAKALSVKRAIAKVYDTLKTELETIHKQAHEQGKIAVAMAHANAPQEAKKCVEELKSTLGLEVLYCDNIGLSVACHTGEGLLGFALIKKL